VDARLRLVIAAARRLPHPETPSARYLALLRAEPRPRRLVRWVLGPVPPSVAVSDGTLELGHGEVRTRSYRPREASAEEPLPLVVNFHGGGFVFGNLAQTDWLCGQVAQRARAVVVSVSYRLAPEHPAPIAAEDCWAITAALQERSARLGADSLKASVMGASAGGNLAALVAIAHRDWCRAGAGRPPLRHQVLIYPVTDMTLSSPSVAELGRAPILTRAIMDWYGRQYLPQGRPDSVAFDDPRVSPLRHPDLAGVAPALIVAAGGDPLRDDATRYGEALERAGVANRVVVYPDAVHGFVSMPRVSPAAALAVEEIVGELREPG
jgi:acetyl esterase